MNLLDLTRQERALLKDLKTRPQPVLLKYPTHPIVKACADRGYVKLSRALSGPLMIPTGEEFATLTEMGLAAIEEDKS